MTNQENGKITLSKAYKHFLTVTKHRNLVMLNCFRAGIPVQGLKHDLSKYSPSEFLVGAKYYQGDHSPNDAERAAMGYSTAWMHHKGINKHHFEYWTDYNTKTRRISPMPMPYKYVVEMFCDRISASKIYLGKDYTNKSPLKYFSGHNYNDLMDSQTHEELEELLVMLAEKGERSTYKFIRKKLKEKKHS